MRKIKFIPFLLCCLAAVSFFASCNDDDDSGLSYQQKEEAIQSVFGGYTGSLLYAVNTTTASGNDTTVVDTVSASWSVVSDSVLTIHNFPVSILGNESEDSSFRAAMKSLPAQDIRCTIYDVVNNSPVTFILAPETVSFELTYGGGTHTVQIPFYCNYYSYAQMVSISSSSSTTRTAMMIQIVQGGIYVDGENTNWISTTKRNIPNYVFISDSRY